MTMSFEQLETVYEMMAQAIDKAGPARESLFLAKLVLLLSHHVGDDEVVHDAIATALRDLPD